MYHSYLTQDRDFIKDAGATELKRWKNSGEDLRTKITHIEGWGLGILGTVQEVTYGTWQGNPACLVSMQFNMRGNFSIFRFRRIEIFVSCEAWTGTSGVQPILRNFSPRNSFVRLDHDRKSWGWEVLQRSWVPSTSQSGVSSLMKPGRAGHAPSICGTQWSNERRQAPHQISWVVDTESENAWRIPDELNFTFVIEYDVSFKAVVEVKAKTDTGIPFPLIAWPWSKDDPLLFNGKTWIGSPPRTLEFDYLTDADWATLAPCIPEWSVCISLIIFMSNSTLKILSAKS